MSTTPAPLSASPDLADLRGELAGDLVLPGDDGWDVARQAWNLSADLHPVAVAFCESADDVAAVVRGAAARGLRVTAQATGHHATSLGALDDTILVRTTRMTGVTVDPAARRARVEAGARWGDVAAAAAPHGLAGRAGSAAHVGVVGYSLGGGVGWLARRHGLAANAVLAVELVTGDGARRRVDADTDADLFWALRGGAGSYGIVTAMELGLVPVDALQAGSLFWPWERAREVLGAWATWTKTLPDEVTSVVRLLQVPPFPDIPEPLRGRNFVIVHAACLTDAPTADDLLAPLRALDPEMDTVATIPPPALAGLHMDPEAPSPGLGGHAVLSDVPDEALDALVAVAGPGSGSPLVSVEVRHAGGALARGDAAHGALDRIEGDYLVFGVGMLADPAAAEAVGGAVAHLQEALRPWTCARGFRNFAEDRSDARAFFADDVVARLQAVKATYDPAGLVTGSHPLPPGPPAAGA